MRLVWEFLHLAGRMCYFGLTALQDLIWNRVILGMEDLWLNEPHVFLRYTSYWKGRGKALPCTRNTEERYLQNVFYRVGFAFMWLLLCAENIVITANDCFVAKKNMAHSYKRCCLQRQALVSEWLQNHAIIRDKDLFLEQFLGHRLRANCTSLGSY